MAIVAVVKEKMKRKSGKNELLISMAVVDEVDEADLTNPIKDVTNVTSMVTMRRSVKKM